MGIFLYIATLYQTKMGKRHGKEENEIQLSNKVRTLNYGRSFLSWQKYEEELFASFTCFCNDFRLFYMKFYLQKSCQRGCPQITSKNRGRGKWGFFEKFHRALHTGEKPVQCSTRGKRDKNCLKTFDIIYECSLSLKMLKNIVIERFDCLEEKKIAFGNDF